MKLDILFEDNHLLIINKPIGVLVQGDKTGDIPLVDLPKPTSNRNTKNRVLFFWE